MNEILQCLCKGIKSRDAYPPSVRAFCMSLHFISPRAYEYLRQKFGKHLPHSQTIRQWYRNSNLDASSGISKQALNALEEKADKMLQNDNKQLTIGLLLDEMKIQKSMSWCRSTNKFVGLIDYGTPIPDEEFTLASDVIVFMASGINVNLQQPLAYYFIRTLKGTERAELLCQIITEISKRGIKVAEITFDGHSANVAMCKCLGTELEVENGEYVTHFLNSYNGEKVYIIFDPSHMIKLVRNALGTLGTIYEGKEQIKWKYLIDLVDVSGRKNFGLTHKVTKRHLEFNDRKMHVRTAVESLSSSAANSIEFLKNTGLDNFAHASGTIKFLRIFDRLWDIMNSQRIRGDNKNVFKSAINEENASEIFMFLEDTKKYIFSLKVRNKKNKLIPIVKAPRKVGFRGFIVDIISVTAIYRDLIESRHWMTFLATYRLSQDHLEMFFGNCYYFF